MAIYKIFPSADATIYSSFPQKNTGIDEIIEVSVKNFGDAGTFTTEATDTPIFDDLRRGLIKFSTSDINKIIAKTSGSWVANLRLSLANAENLSAPYTLNIVQVKQDWNMGTGKFLDNPETRNGVCWYTATASYAGTSSIWHPQYYYLTPGGGSWTSNVVTQSFDYMDNKDINADVTSIVADWSSSYNPNYGFLIRHQPSVENDPNSYIVLSYFSVDTHTIYPPCLEFKWDDSSWVTGSLGTIADSEFIVTIPNTLENFKNDTYYKFRVNARDRFPLRVFTTSSLYTVNKYLPSSSYWGIQDVKTEEMIVDFDTKYTRLSADANGNYFYVYMGGLQPERSYKLLIKAVFPSGETVDVYSDDYIFKVVR